MSLEGILIKGYGGFYYVKTESNVWKCHLRGKHRFNKKDFLPGDRVKFRERGNNVGIVEELLPRKNRLLRPPVANVDQVVIIVALDQPKPDRMLLDRLLLMTESAGINVLICFSKVDLIKKDLPVMLPEIYRRIGYHVYLTSATGEGKEHLVRACKGKISVFAGASGVGKSSLLNTLQEGLCLNTASVSEKNKRGRHTTRNVELLELENGGLVADTPGFNRLFLPKKVTRRDLRTGVFHSDILEHGLVLHQSAENERFLFLEGNVTRLQDPDRR